MARVESFDDVISANAGYSETFSYGATPGRAARGLAVVTCMDSRIDPLAVLGLQVGDAKIIRNAGARVTDDVLTTLVLASFALQVDRIMVIPHTDCGMVKNDEDAVHAATAARGVDSRSLDFDTIADQPARLRHDVRRILSMPQLPAGIPVIGCVYDVTTGLLQPPVASGRVRE